MTPRAGLITIGLTLGVALHPDSSLAQAVDACDPSDRLLFHCTFDDGAKQVGVCLSGDLVTYSFGPDRTSPELALSGTSTDVGYEPFDWTSGTIYESVTFLNVDTAYEVFSTSSKPVIADAVTEGGIVITFPNGTKQALACDAGSITPTDPTKGIGQLVMFTFDDPLDQLRSCSAWPDPANNCLGSIRDAEIAQRRCIPAADRQDCWDTELTVWNVVLEAQFDTTLARATELQGEQFGETLRVAQDSWAIGRNLDCDVYWLAPLAPDAGKAQCLAQYAAHRVQFLQDVIHGLEFDG